MNSDSALRDHQELEPNIIKALNKSNFLDFPNRINRVHIVRLIPTEYNFIKDFPVGEIFSHIGLQHFGVPYEFEDSGIIHACVKILKHGTNTKTDHVPPVLDTSSFIAVKFLGYSHSFEINNPENILI